MVVTNSGWKQVGADRGGGIEYVAQPNANDEGVSLRVDGEVYPRILLRGDGNVFVGDGTAYPSHLNGDAGVYFGTVNPSNTLGVNGDIYVKTAAGAAVSVWQKLLGTWVQSATFGGGGGGGGDALTTNPLSQFAATTSAQLAGVMSDETGTGALVFGTGPALSAPTGLVKADVGLPNVDNTSDANKPVSTAQAAADALALKIASNLSDVNNAATSRTNLGVAIGSNVEAWDADLDALAALGSTGLAARTAANTWAQRSLAAGSAKLTVTNPAGVAGNPTIDLGSVASTDLSDSGSLARMTDLAALDAKDEVAYAATAALPSCTYANGASGVGATLTATANGPLIIDGVTTVLGAQGLGVLVAAQASAFQDGWYSLSQQGVVAISPWILTRRTPDDQAAEIGPGYLTAVVAPSGLTAGSNNGKVYVSIAPTPFVVGTDSVTFSQVGSTYSAGTGLGLSGTTFSIDTAITVDKTTAQTLSMKTLTSPVLNTGVSGTAIDTDSTFAANSDTILASQKAIATAIALKANLASPALTGTPTFAGSTSGSTGLKATAVASGTLTLPAATGTLISSADSGTVTSAMIADATIVNADISASAAIASSKLATVALANGGTGQTTAQGAINALSGLTTAGDVEIFDGTNTTRLAITTAAGAAVVADPNATAKISVNYPHGVEAANRGATGSLASTYDRSTLIEQNLSSALSTGRIFVSRILLPKGMSITSITWWSMTTALATGVNQWFVICDVNRNKLAITGDDTSTAWAANTAKTLTITGGPYVTTTAGWYYLGIMVKATTEPSLCGLGSLGNANIRAAAPIPSGTCDTGLTNPASCPSQLAAVSQGVTSSVGYAEVS